MSEPQNHGAAQKWRCVLGRNAARAGAAREPGTSWSGPIMIDTAAGNRPPRSRNEVSSAPSGKQARNFREGTCGWWRPGRKRVCFSALACRALGDVRVV
jgi:hypothetical protein